MVLAFFSFDPHTEGTFNSRICNQFTGQRDVSTRQYRWPETVSRRTERSWRMRGCTGVGNPQNSSLCGLRASRYALLTCTATIPWYRQAGTNNTFETMWSSLEWDNGRRIVEEWCASSRLCEVNRKLSRDPRTPLPLNTPSPLMESVSIDILGALLGSRLQIAVNTCS